jgi:hypothetical protein
LLIETTQVFERLILNGGEVTAAVGGYWEYQPPRFKLQAEVVPFRFLAFFLAVFSHDWELAGLAVICSFPTKVQHAVYTTVVLITITFFGKSSVALITREMVCVVPKAECCNKVTYNAVLALGALNIPSSNVVVLT